jgi:hypothetical protein
MKILKDKKIAPIHVMPGDSITLSYNNPERDIKNEVVCKALVSVKGIADRALIFESEEKGVLLGGVIGSNEAVEQFKGRNFDND